MLSGPIQDGLVVDWWVEIWKNSLERKTGKVDDESGLMMMVMALANKTGPVSSLGVCVFVSRREKEGAVERKES